MYGGIQLQQKQVKKIHMTPALSQAIKLLQYSTLELAEFLNEQISANPLLQHPDHVKGERCFSTAKSPLDPIQFIEAAENKLESELLEQLVLLNLEHRQEKMMKFLISNLDSHGFLSGGVPEAERVLGISRAEAKGLIGLLQQLEPMGIGTANSKDFLLLQIDSSLSFHYKEIAKTLIENDLVKMASGSFHFLSAKYQVNRQILQEITDFIKNLKLYPAEEYSRSPVPYVIPDVVIEEIDRRWIIHITDHLLPSIKLNEKYIKNLLASQQDEVESYVQQRLKDAQFLRNSLKSRKETLYHVTAMIMDHQEAFFQKGESFIQPMRLKDLAQKLQLHESTISRITSNKYIQTPHGLYTFKYFFTHGLPNSTTGHSESVSSIKVKLASLIENENPSEPYSDEQLKVLLKQQGVPISRRTIAKYREQLKFANSMNRRRY
ncbi:RNA polymerase factor sigma-54 [uncultured Planococcus sp.]|uniref:RNA polymerase factor sigma-54 n=1 Tax=uncultured Planococcus sp. TaxID=337815 RepID=UPI0026220285|nr:RNA polymerase factor sigma-54 [uncultured Planococcus sp.]